MSPRCSEVKCADELHARLNRKGRAARRLRDFDELVCRRRAAARACGGCRDSADQAWPLSVSIREVRVFFRVLLALEVSATLIGGVSAMVRPSEFLPNIASGAPGAAAVVDQDRGLMR
jgi:hypothetical protein